MEILNKSIDIGLEQGINALIIERHKPAQIFLNAMASIENIKSESVETLPDALSILRKAKESKGPIDIVVLSGSQSWDKEQGELEVVSTIRKEELSTSIILFTYNHERLNSLGPEQLRSKKGIDVLISKTDGARGIRRGFAHAKKIINDAKSAPKSPSV